jgi:hypothetical protein
MKAAQKSGRFNPNPAPGCGEHPHRRIYLVNATGTHPLGDTEAVWRAASPPQQLAS